MADVAKKTAGAGKRERKTPSKFMRTSAATNSRATPSRGSRRQNTDLSSLATPTTPTAPGTALSGTRGNTPQDKVTKNHIAPVVQLPNGQSAQLGVADLSNQALTNVPDSVWESRSIGILDLSANNISQIGSSISRLTYLHELHVNNTAIRCRNANDNDGLSKNLSKLNYLRTLSIQCCNLMFVPPVIWELRNLTELYLNRNRIHVLPSEIGKLKNLRVLNLQLTGITTLPPEIAYCQELEELTLYGNAIQSLPETVSELNLLHTLNISYTVFTTANVDSYMENLIQKQQIQSEHISPVVFHLRSLREMDLSQTKINSFPQHSLSSLTHLDLSNNYIRIFPKSITTLEKLRDLNISNNELETLPESFSNLAENLRRLKMAGNRFESIPEPIFSLSHLKELDCSQNKIREIPPDVTKLSKLKRFILFHNELTELPEFIVELRHIETLDVSKNHIVQVPGTIQKINTLNFMHTFEGLKQTGLWLIGNPEMSNPPPVVWMGDDIGLLCDSIRRLTVQSLAKEGKLNPTRIVVLGDDDMLKTAIIKQFVGIHMMDSGSKICSMHKWTSSNGVPFILYNLHNQVEASEMLMPLYLVEAAIVIVVFNYKELDATQPFEPSCLERWLQAISVCSPQAVVKLVGIDCEGPDVEMDEVFDRIPFELVKGNARTKIEVMKYIKRISEAITRFQDTSFGTSKISAVNRIRQIHAKRLEMLAELKDQETLLRLCREVTVVDDWKNSDRWEELEWQMELLATNDNLSPHVQMKPDKSWLDFSKNLLKLNKPLIDWQQAIQEASVAELEPRSDSFSDALKFLQGSGKIGRYLYGKWIHVRPSQLMKAIEPLLGSTPDVELPVLKHRTRFPEDKFQLALQAFRQGSISEPMLKSAIFFPTANHITSMKQTEKILEEFGIAYVRCDTKTQGPEHLQSWFLTWILQMKENSVDYQENLENVWPEAFQGGSTIEKIEFWPVVGTSREVAKFLQFLRVRIYQSSWLFLELGPSKGFAAEIRRNPDSEFTKAYLVVTLEPSGQISVTARGQDVLYVSWALDVIANVVDEFYLLYPGMLLSEQNHYK